LRDRNGEVAYVGISKNIRSRIDQHPYRRDSSIATGVSTTSLNADFVTKVEWWLGPLFEEKAAREAAEVIAFGRFDPSLRSRGKLTATAKAKLEDERFRSEVTETLTRRPDGSYLPKNLDNLCNVVRQLVNEVEDLKRNLSERGNAS
jgi:hypothetical protein